MGIINDITGSDLLTGGTSLLGTAIGAITGASMAKKEREFNAAQAELNRDFQTSEREAAQEWNLAQWNRENEYNTPEAQMKRMVAAGINPNIAAQAIGGNATSPGQVRTSGQSGSQASGSAIAGNLMDLVGNSVNTMWQNINQQRDAEGKDIDNQYKGKLYGKQLEQADAAITEMISSAAKNDQERKNAEETGKWIAQRSEAEIKTMNQTLVNLQQEWKQMEANIKNIEANTGLVEQQTDNEEIQGKILTEQQKIEQMKASLAQQGIIAGYNDLQSLFIYMKENDVSELFNTFVSFLGLDPNGEDPNNPKLTPEEKRLQKLEASVEEYDAAIAEAEAELAKHPSRVDPVRRVLESRIKSLKAQKQKRLEKIQVLTNSYTPYGAGDVNP